MTTPKVIVTLDNGVRWAISGGTGTTRCHGGWHHNPSAHLDLVHKTARCVNCWALFEWMDAETPTGCEPMGVSGVQTK